MKFVTPLGTPGSATELYSYKRVSNTFSNCIGLLYILFANNLTTAIGYGTISDDSVSAS